MSHEKCSKKIMDETMKDFEKHKLKQRDEKVVTKRKQAVAIGLSRVEQKCKYSNDEYKDLEEKVIDFLKSKPEEKIPLSRVVEVKKFIEYLNEKEKYNKSRKIEIMLWHYIVTAVSMNIEVTENIWSELKDIKKITEIEK